jgi:hypothetical protein
MKPLLIVFGCLPFLTGCVHTDIDAARPIQSSEQHSAMATIVSMEYNQVPLRQVLEDLTRQYGFDTAIQDHALPRAEAAVVSRVVIRDAPLGEALDILLRPFQLRHEYDPAHDAVIITTR